MAPADGGYRARLDAVLADAHRAADAWHAQLPDELRALMPLDATPISAGLALLADAAGIGASVATAQREQSRANAAVLHGRVFGRGAAISQETALAAFADGARVRDGLIGEVAEAIGGPPLRREVDAVLAPPPARASDCPASELTAALAEAFAAQEHALELCAAHLDALSR